MNDDTARHRRSVDAALERIMERMRGTEARWALTGSLGMALQGVPVEVHDIDIQTDARGAQAIAQALEAWVVEPIRWRAEPGIRSWFGAFRIGQVRVEVMGDIEKRLPLASRPRLWRERKRIPM